MRQILSTHIVQASIRYPLDLTAGISVLEQPRHGVPEVRSHDPRMQSTDSSESLRICRSRQDLERRTDEWHWASQAVS
jgi:hypothetical protein